MKKIMTAVLMVALAASAAAAQPNGAEEGKAPKEGNPPVIREGAPAPRDGRGPGAPKERPGRPPRGPEGPRDRGPERGPRPGGPNGPRMEGPCGPRDGMNGPEGPRMGAPRGPEGGCRAPRVSAPMPPRQDGSMGNMPPCGEEIRPHNGGPRPGEFNRGPAGEFVGGPMPAPQQYAPISGPRALGFTVKQERTSEGYFVVDEVTPATAAAYAGVKSGAILYAIDGNTTAQVGIDQMYAYIQKRWSANATAVVTFSDGDEQKSVPIKL